MNKLLLILFLFITVAHAQQNNDCVDCTRTDNEEMIPLKLKNSQFLKNYFEVGAIYGSAFKQGGIARYNIVNKNRNKTSWSFESTYTNSMDGLEGLSVAINKHIGKNGLFIGGNAEVARFKLDYVDTKPTIMVPFLGMQFGWKYFWDKNRRIASLVQVGVEGVQYEFKNLVMPEAKAGITYRLGGGKVNKRK